MDINDPNLQIDPLEIDAAFKKLKSKLFKTNEDNRDKIKFIKEELSANRYEIQSHKIALKLLEHRHLRNLEQA